MSGPLTVAAVAAVKGCSERTVRRACESGDLRAQRIGARVWAITPRAAAAWIPRPKAGRPPRA